MNSRTIGRLVTAVFMVALVGCGNAGALVMPVGGSPAAVQAPPVATTAGTPYPVSPTAAPRVGVSPQVPAAHSTAGPVTQAPPAPMTFAIMPLFPRGAAGTITVVVANGVAHYHGVVTGLAPGSAHTIHDHAGMCGGSLSSRHLSVLITASADARGLLVFDATVPAFDFGAGRIVIVYESARAAVIAGCATL